MLKLLYAGLVAAFSGVLILVSAQQGLFSREGKSGLTANFQLVSEIPISSSPGENFKNTASDGTFKKVVAVPVASPKSIEIVIPAPKSDPVPVPVFTPLSPTKVALPTPPSTPTPAPIIAPILTPEPIPVLQLDPIPATDPEPEPTSAPEPQSTPTPEPTPVPELEPTPPLPVPEPTPAPQPEPIQVLIVEIQTGTTAGGAEDEFVKLYNPTNAEIDLTGWALKKKTSTGTFSNLVSVGAFSGKITAKGYFIVAHEGYQGSNVVNLIYSANSNNLSYTNNSAVLYYSDGSAMSVMDEISWVEIPKDTIWTRP